MPLVNDTPETENPAEGLARDAKIRLSEFSKTAFLVYGNLLNYQNNNLTGVSKADFAKALGKEAKDFDYVMGAMKRLLLKLNPALKDQLDAMAPKKSKQART